jgi:hypothetical protein
MDRMIFPAGEDVETYRTRGMDLACCLQNGSMVQEPEQVISISEAAACPLVDRDGVVLDAPLIFETDLVALTPESEKVIVDWKVGARRSGFDAELQPTGYTYGYHTMHGEHLRFLYEVCVANQKPVMQTAFTSRVQDDWFRLVELIKVIERMTRIGPEAFWPNHHAFCATCGQRPSCEQWHRYQVSDPVRIAA